MFTKSIHQGKVSGKSLLYTLLMILFLPVIPAEAAEYEVALDRMPQEMTVQNAGSSETPTVYIIGQPHVGEKDVKLTKGLTINGVRLTENLLSESVLILYPDGGGKWGYNTGFDFFRGPLFKDGKIIDPRSTVEYGKVNYDPLDRVWVVGGGNMNKLLLYNNRQNPPLRYHIAFPNPIKIKSFTVHSNCDQIRQEDVAVTVTLYADKERKKVIQQRVIGGSKGRFPVVFNGLDSSSLYFEMSAVAEKGTVGLYYTRLEADLDTGNLALPMLEPGRNVIKVNDDEDSSHSARIVLRWLGNKPSGKAIFDDFEEGSHWGVKVKKVEGSWENGHAFTGNSFARLEFPADGKDHSFARGISPAMDLTGCNRLGIASRVQQKAPMTAILIALRHADGKWSRWIGGVQPSTRWNYQTFDISNIRRDSVTGIRIYFVATRGYNRPDEPCIYDIDTLSFFHEEEKPADTPNLLPAHVAAYRSPYDEKNPPKREIPPVQEWFPMGFYDGTTSRTQQEAVWLLDQMKKLNMNTIYLSNGSLDGSGDRLGLTGLLPLAEARGVRLIYQGSSPGGLFMMGKTQAERQHNLENIILPTARKRVPEFRDSWGLLAWSLSEEIKPEEAAGVKPYYDAIREMAPNQPPTILHNNIAPAKIDLETNKPLVITHDRYPFFWSPRSGPSTPSRSVPYYYTGIADFYREARKNGASLWMMPQAWSEKAKEILEPPNYGYITGMRKPEPGEIKQQGWLAVAEGATGIMYFAGVSRKQGSGRLWDYGFKETENTRAAGELFTQLQRVAPLLVRLERDYKEDGFVKILSGEAVVRSFTKRQGYPGSGRYIVLASLDGFNAQNISLQVDGGQKIYNMVERREISGTLGNLKIGPGEGMVLLVGTPQQFSDDCRMIDEQLHKYYQ